MNIYNDVQSGLTDSVNQFLNIKGLPFELKLSRRKFDETIKI